MGSITPTTNGDPLPPASAPHLRLAHPTAAEMRRTWSLNHAEWGGALGLDDYLAREPYLTTIPLAAEGGMAHWVLTHDEPSSESTCSAPGASATAAATGTRRVLASCETMRKRALVAVAGGSGNGDGDGDGEVQVTVKDAIAYGVGSVFTPPECRGQGYAGRMLAELTGYHRRLLLPSSQEKGGQGKGEQGKWEQESGEGQGAAAKGKAPDPPVASVLWSDIGKVFYAKKGWAPHASVHACFPVDCAALTTTTHNSDGEQTTTTSPITYANLQPFCELDERLLRARLARMAARKYPGHGHGTRRRTVFALAPDYDTMRWHMYRDDFIARRVLPGLAGAGVGKGVGEGIVGEGEGKGGGKGLKEDTFDEPPRGAVAGPPGRRVWAVWAKNYVGDATDAAKNTLYILRLAYESDEVDSPSTGWDEGEDEEGSARGSEGTRGLGKVVDAELQESFDAVLGAARDVARRWGLGKMELWNPTGVTRALIAGGGGGGGEGWGVRWVERERDSIPSLMWYGEGEGEDDGEAQLDWVANEKFCWF